MSDRHGWNSWEQYQAAQESFLEHFLDHFITENTLQAEITSTLVRWDGVLVCVDGFEIHVKKEQAVRYRDGRPEVRTVYYSYHVLQRTDVGVRNLVRYDNAHEPPGHPTRHHRHHKMDAGAADLEPPEHVGAAGWPTLGDVVEEAYRLWYQMKHGDGG